MKIKGQMFSNGSCICFFWLLGLYKLQHCCTKDVISFGYSMLSHTFSLPPAPPLFGW
jgi:hypothetical protein